MRKVDSLLKECLRIEGVKLSNYSYVCWYGTVVLIGQLISNHFAQDFDRLHIL